jgi:hypothetical protein
MAAAAAAQRLITSSMLEVNAQLPPDKAPRPPPDMCTPHLPLPRPRTRPLPAPLPPDAAAPLPLLPPLPPRPLPLPEVPPPLPLAAGAFISNLMPSPFMRAASCSGVSSSSSSSSSLLTCRCHIMVNMCVVHYVHSRSFSEPLRALGTTTMQVTKDIMAQINKCHKQVRPQPHAQQTYITL